MNADGEKAALVHFNEVWPLSKKHFDFLDKAKFVAVVENNFTGQFAHLMAKTTGKIIENKINKFNGLPFEAAEIVAAYRALKAKKKRG